MATQQMSQALDKELLLLDLFSPSNTANPYSGSKSYSLAPDVFQLACIIILSTILAVFYGTCFLEDCHIFLLKDLMELQDKIEHATAAAAILPCRVANWLVLGPTCKFRLKVQEKIVLSSPTLYAMGSFHTVAHSKISAKSRATLFATNREGQCVWVLT